MKKTTMMVRSPAGRKTINPHTGFVVPSDRAIELPITSELMRLVNRGQLIRDREPAAASPEESRAAAAAQVTRRSRRDESSNT